MARPTIDVAAELARLAALTLFEVRAEWRRVHRRPPPARLSREHLTRGITYQLQERALGGLSKAILRKLDLSKVGIADQRKSIPAISPRPGTRLVREWHGVTQTVLVHEDGVEWRGERYPSLTVVAQMITGAHWSGPRFFGLRKSLPKLKPEVGDADQ